MATANLPIRASYDGAPAGLRACFVVGVDGRVKVRDADTEPATG